MAPETSTHRTRPRFSPRGALTDAPIEVRQAAQEAQDETDRTPRDWRAVIVLSALGAFVLASTVAGALWTVFAPVAHGATGLAVSALVVAVLFSLEPDEETA